MNRGYYGNLCYLDSSLEKLSVKSEMSLKGSSTLNPNQTASQDSVLKMVIISILMVA